MNFDLTRLKDCEYKDINAPVIGAMLYWEKGNGVIAYIIVKVDSYDDDNNIWESDDISEVMSGSIFDGETRHFELGDNGYLHYPNFDFLKICFDEIKKLQKAK